MAKQGQPKSVIGKIQEILVGPTRPQTASQYGDVVIPWYKRLGEVLRPPSKVPTTRKKMVPQQKRLITGVVAALVLIGGSWGAYSYFSSVRERSAELVQQGMRLLGPNNLEGARDKFSEAIGVWAENDRAYLERGNVNRILGDSVGATEDWTRAIEINPMLVDAYTARATMYRVDGNLTGALADLNHALEIAPSMDAYFQRGQVYHAQGDFQKALDDYARSIDQQPGSPYVYRARALTKAQLGDEKGAREDERQADRLQHIP